MTGGGDDSPPRHFRPTTSSLYQTHQTTECDESPCLSDDTYWRSTTWRMTMQYIGPSFVNRERGSTMVRHESPHRCGTWYPQRYYSMVTIFPLQMQI